MKNIMCFILFLISFSLSGQREDIREWPNKLREFLAIDSTYCKDSIVHFVTGYGEAKQLSISKKRPNFVKANQLIDSVGLCLEIDMNFAKLLTVLLEYDINYLQEFTYSKGTSRGIFHPYLGCLDCEELNLIGKIENLLLIEKLLKDSSNTVVKLMVFSDPKFWKEQGTYSTTWERYGKLDLSYLESIYLNNIDEYEDELKDILKIDLDLNECYGILYFLDLFDNAEKDKIACDRLNYLVDDNTSKNIIKALSDLNQKFYEGQGTCITALVNKYK